MDYKYFVRYVGGVKWAKSSWVVRCPICMEEEFFADAFSEATCTLQDEFPTCDWCQVRIDRRQQLTNKIAEKHAMQGVDAISEAEVLEAVATAAYKVAGWLEALAAGL